MSTDVYCCIHCGKESLASEWREEGLVCPLCGGADDCPGTAEEMQAAHDASEE